MGKEKILFWSDRVIEYGFYAVLVLVPLVLTPWNFELFEFNKMVVTYGLTVVIVGAWLVKMVMARRVIFRMSAFGGVLFVFLLSQVVSTLFSIDRHTSLFGYYSRFHGGLLSTFSYLLLFWAVVTNLDREKVMKGIYFILGTATVVILYGVAEHFGIDKEMWVQDVQNRVFSTLGQPNWLAAWLVGINPLVWVMIMKEERGGKGWKRWWPYVLSGLIFLTLLFTKSRSGILGWMMGGGLFWLAMGWFARERWRELIKPFLGVFLPIVFLASWVGTPWTPNITSLISKEKAPEEVVEMMGTQLEAGGSESGEIRKIVWEGAVKIWKAYPVFGSGVETFAYSYYKFRPRAHNDVSEWDFLYNKAHNEYLNFAATSGTAGLLAYLLLMGWFVVWVVKKWREEQGSLQYIKVVLLVGFLAGFLSIGVTNFFGFSVVPVALLFYLYPAMAVVVLREGGERVEVKFRLNWARKMGVLAIGGVVVYLLFTLGGYWYGDVLYAKGKKLNKAGEYRVSLPLLEKAIVLNPGEPNYKTELAETNAVLAVVEMQQNRSSLAEKLTEEAIRQSDGAVAISPRHVNFWKDRTVMFYRLSEIDSEFLNEALEALLEAKELAPTDVKIAHNLGVLYYTLGDKTRAVEALEETIRLKSTYKDSYVALAVIYEKEKDKQKAREVLEAWFKINPEDETIRSEFEELLR